MVGQAKPVDSANYLVKMSSQALAAGLSSFGSSIGQGFQNYMAGRERRELLSGEAMAYGSQLKEKQAQGIKLSSNEEAMLKKLENVGDMGTRELQSIISEYETDEKMEQLQRQKKLHENQLRRDQYFFDQQDRAIKRDKAVADVYGQQLIDSQTQVPETKTRVIDAVFADGGEYSPTGPEMQFFDSRLDEYGVPRPKQNFAYTDQVQRNFDDTLDEYGVPKPPPHPIFDELNNAQSKFDKLTQMQDSFLADVNKAIDEQNISAGYMGKDDKSGFHGLPFAKNYEEAKRWMRGEKLLDEEGNPTGADYIRETHTGRTYEGSLEPTIPLLQPNLIKPVRDKMKGMADLIDNYAASAYEAQGDIRNKLFNYMPASGDLEAAAKAYAIDEQSQSLPAMQTDAPDVEPVTLRSRNMVSPEREEEYVEMRDKTELEKEEALSRNIAERAADLGAEGIKQVKELVKNSDLQLVELQGTNYVFSPKSGSFQIIPSEKDGASFQDQARILAELGMAPEEATVKLLDGTSVKFVVPSKEDGGPKTENQAKAYMHAGTMKLTEGVITEMTQKGFDASSIMNSFELYHDQNAIKSPEAKRYAAAMNKWLEAYLRYVSGAAIAEHEYKGARAQFFPLVGDSDEAVADKKRLRSATFALMQKVSGGKANVEELTNQIGSFQLQSGETLRLVSDSEEEATAEAQRRGLKSGDTYTWIDKNKGMEYTYTVD